MNLMHYKKLYFLISALFLIPSIFSLIVWGIKPSIDFTGGSILELRTQNLEPSKISETEGIEGLSVQKSGEETYILKTKEIDEQKKNQLLENLKTEFGEIEEVRFETVGPSIGKELIKKTILAIVLAAGFILLYVAYRFKDKKYGVCAILAMFHDTIILLGAFSLLGHFLGVEIDTLFVTALLTILSFSVHDTVVVYDQIRDSIKKNPQVEFKALVNKAVVETLPRSINNSMTIIFMLLCLYLLGGQTIRWFSLALLIGTISGTYSSTFTAAPLLIVWDKFKKK